jgi:hypothetical protein
MSEEEKNRSGNEEPILPPAVTPKLWYQRKSTWFALTAAVFWYMFYRPIEVTREPWQVLDPGQPVEPLKFEVVEAGSGPVVEPGDLIQVSLDDYFGNGKKVEQKKVTGGFGLGFEQKRRHHSILSALGL